MLQPIKLHFHNLFKHPIKSDRNRFGVSSEDRKPAPTPSSRKPFSKCIPKLRRHPHCLIALTVAKDKFLIFKVLIYEIVSVVKAHVTLEAPSIATTEETQVNVISKKLVVHEDYDSVEITNDIARRR
ncbi:hypothetical protein BDFB_008809 [Asbolus verrucosus]|uniref:Uncharacterized protein n=1 Tax=Asbolus verrucosus TaxID=1661398 RepID=A0A482W725_ASBVE|nr:hypothetical protein BDFB_008809 [Asbolus verrucosus]